MALRAAQIDKSRNVVVVGKSPIDDQIWKMMY